MEAIVKGLNAAQRAAVTSPASVLQVLAPPGSGKTKTLTSRVAYLLAHNGYAPWNVICCTFTIKASKEMRERLRGIVGCELESKLILGTFHSICRRYLMRYGHLIGLSSNFGIANTSDSLSILKRAQKLHKLSIDPKVARTRISHRKARGQRIDDLPKVAEKNLDRQEFITIYHEYERSLAASNLLDYDDLLLRCTDLLREHPQCVSNIEALLIDEFQDTNVVQYELMRLLASAKKRITIVGDPDQSIYGFRSAEIENLRKMKADYPDTVVINLEENYRSSSAILKLAQDVIEQDTNRPDKKLAATHCYGTLPVLRKVPNPHEEALWIVSEIRRMITMTGGLLQHADIAILLRSAFLSLLIEKALSNGGIPYRMVGGFRFFDRVEVRLVIDYLRVISSPDNNAAFSAIINVPARKIGEKTIEDLARLADAKNTSLFSIVEKLLAGHVSLERKLSKPAELGLQKLVNLIKDARKTLPGMPPSRAPRLLIEHVVSALELKEYLRVKYDEDHEERWENVQELLLQASDIVEQQGLSEEEVLPEIQGLEQRQLEGGEEVVRRFLANIVLSTELESSEEEEKQPRVTISTIHSAKGLEWPVVFIPAVYEGSIPHSRADDTDEERRLMYVAMTRAKALLSCSFPLMQSRDMGESVLSQFLPLDIHRRFAAKGPDFDDEVVENIASILRRPCPSPEDLARGLSTLGDKDSMSDDLWPVDGSHRKSEHWNQETAGGMFMTPADSGEFTFNETGLGGFGGFQRRSLSTNSSSERSGISVGSGYRSIQTVATTMSHSNSFSVPTMSTTFTTASERLRVETASMQIPTRTGIASRSTPLPTSSAATKSSRNAKVDPKQSNLSNFFSRGSPKAPNPPLHITVANGDVSTERRPPSPVLPLPATTRYLSTSSYHRPSPTEPVLPCLPPRQIPAELSAHQLGVKKAPLKRPRAALEEVTSPNRDRKRYVFLSSSPKQAEDTTVSENTASYVPETSIKLALVTKSSPSTTMSMTIQHVGLSGTGCMRPAATMHTTSMAMLQQGGAGGVRRTLGVKRSMNGWADRKIR